MTDKMQALMDAAYTRWQAEPGTSKEAFWDTLSANERFAVFLGNLNQQVCNGGFMQWQDNRYATPETVAYITRACDRIATPAAAEVKSLVEQFWAMAEGGADFEDEAEYTEFYNGASPLDTAFYAVNEQFLADAEEYLTVSQGAQVV